MRRTIIPKVSNRKNTRINNEDPNCPNQSFNHYFISLGLYLNTFLLSGGTSRADSKIFRITYVSIAFLGA